MTNLSGVRTVHKIAPEVEVPLVVVEGVAGGVAGVKTNNNRNKSQMEVVLEIIEITVIIPLLP